MHEQTQPLFRRSLEAQLLAKALADKSHDPIFTYDELSKIAGVKDITEHRSALNTARRAVCHDHRIVFETILGVGIKRATDVEIIGGRTKDRTRVRRIASLARKKLSCVKFEDLDKDQQRRLSVEDAALGIVAECASSRGVANIEQKVIERKGGKLEIGDLRSAFK